MGKGTCLDKIHHDKCGHNTLQVYEREDGTVDGFCWFPDCCEYVKDPYGEQKLAKDIPAPKGKRPKKSPEEIKKELETIKALGAVDLVKRRLRKADLDAFGIRVGFSTKDGKTPALMFFPYTSTKSRGEITKFKVKVLDTGQVWSIGDSTDINLFGWEEAIAKGAKRLIITEGEPDTAAMKKILDMYTKDAYKDYIPAVVSLPNGAASASRDLSRLSRLINRNFKEISFSFDDDDAGKAAVVAGMKVFPHATSIELPCKDANDCIIKGKTKGAFNAVTFNAAKPKNTRLVFGRDVHEQAKLPAQWGLSFPFPWLTDKTRGLRTGETYYFAAGEKMGKSEFVNAFAAHFMKEHDMTVMLAKPEEANNKTYKMILSKLVSKVFHDPKVAFDEAAYELGAKWARDKLIMLNLYQHVGWESLKLDITEAASLGAKLVVIDPITNLTNGLSNSDIDAHLKGVAQEAAAMAMDLDITIFFFCHLNKPPKGATPWDRGGKITTDYFAGSSAMARSCNYAFGIEGNKDPELGLEDVRRLVLLADREFGESGYVDLFWNRQTTQFAEMKEGEV